ncbi:MAG: PTS ascorbate transporter subunit IIC [Firmicutes bacterium]|nr:PTS ascorbate transporter subunit IIC [Bacillota bacterium]
MSTFEAIASFLATNIFGQPAVLIALVAMVGLVAQRKSFSDTVMGTIKTMAGFLILVIGAGVIVQALNNFTPIIQQAFGITPVPDKGMGLDKFMATYSGAAALIMTFGFLINVILARLTPFKYIYLTGHLMFWVSLVMLAVMKEVSPNASMTSMVVVGSVIMGLYWTLQPAFIHRAMTRVTESGAVAFGHTSSSGAWLASVLGRFVGKPEQSTEKVTLPENISFIKDVTVGTSVVVSLVAVIAALFAGQSFVSKQAGSMNYIIYALLEGFKFGAGTTVLLIGVRMILAEIVPAFRGIATRIVPNAKPALDCPIVFNYAPMGVIIGFLSATAMFLVLMLVFGATGFAVIIPPMIQLFFPGGAAGVFGNSTGGIRGAILGGALMGALLAFGQAITAPMLSTTASQLALMADPDWYILILVFKPLLALFM